MGRSLVFETPRFPQRTIGLRVWFMAVMAVAAAALAASLTRQHRWEMTVATVLGGSIGLMLAAGAIRAKARHGGVPLASRIREMGEFRIHIHSVAAWRFMLHFLLPLGAAGQLITDQAIDGRPFWTFTTHSWTSFSSEVTGWVLMGVVGRWFMRHALKSRDEWGMDTTKGRIAPAPRVK